MESVREIVIIFILNRKAEWFINQRLSTKKLYPNMFGFGAGGKVEEGEDSIEAAYRELREETGLERGKGQELREIGEVIYNDDLVHHRIYLFELITDQAISNYDREWSWSDWMLEDKIVQLISQGEVCPDTVCAYNFYKSCS